jgi:hypothetical protein
MSDVIITKELLIDVMGACDIGPDFIEKNNLWGQPDESVICPALKAAGLNDAADWWLAQKKTEKFVRYNGKEFTLVAYQIFNPLTGLHTRYETEAEATAALIEAAKAILVQHLPTVCRELSNENGDKCWTAVDFSNKYKVVEN